MESDTKAISWRGVERPVVLLMLMLLTGLAVWPLVRGQRLHLSGLPSRTTAATALPAPGLMLSTVDGIIAGHGAGCAMGGGAVQCWGNTLFGQASVDDTQPAPVTGLQGEVLQVSVGSGFACAILQSASGAQQIVCWGANWGGTLGDGATEASARPVAVAGLAGHITHLSAGLAHVCATVDGAPNCWGSNWFGELGTGASSPPLTTPAALDLPVQKVVAGYHHTCALMNGGSVQCWGNGSAGQLGNSSNEIESATPVGVQGLAASVVDVAAGGGHTCALLVDGRVQCWGANWWGQLGDGTTAQHLIPVFAAIEDAVAITAGGGHTCALKQSGAAYCWGDNAKGQLGDGSTLDQTVPRPVRDLMHNVITLSAGSDQTCALLESGEARCWGAGMP